MESAGGVVRTDKCYCDIPRERLAYLVQQHFIKHVPTQVLMQQMTTDEEREQMAVVALLDVPKDDLVKILEVEDPEKLVHWYECHKNIRLQLAEEGLNLKGVA